MAGIPSAPRVRAAKPMANETKTPLLIPSIYPGCMSTDAQWSMLSARRRVVIGSAMGCPRLVCDVNGDVYYGMVADAYDWYLGDPPDVEVAFFTSFVADEGAPGLELACGTGRILIELAARGLDVDGVDSSGDMLVTCRRKAAERGVRVGLFEQYAQEMTLDRRYGSVYCPGSSFMLFVDPPDTTAVLSRVFRHLLPGGRAALTMSVPQPGDGGGWRIRREVKRPDTGTTLRLWERVSLDLEQQIQTNELRNEVVAGGEVVTAEQHSTRLKWWTPAQFTDLLVESGFEDVAITDGFTDTPAGPHSAEYVAVARTPDQS